MARHVILAVVPALIGLAACSSGNDKDDFRVPDPRVFAADAADTLHATEGDRYRVVNSAARLRTNGSSRIRSSRTRYVVSAAGGLTPGDGAAGSADDVLGNLRTNSGDLHTEINFRRGDGAVVNGIPTFERTRDGLTYSMRFFDGAAGLSYSTFGDWRVENRSGNQTAGFGTFGKETRNLPRTGTLSYSGLTVGATADSDGRFDLSGNAALEVNFANGRVTGLLDGITATAESDGSITQFNAISLSGSIRDGVMVGDARVTDAPTGPAAMPIATEGSFAGRIYGPDAEEVGGDWTLIGGDQVAIGAFGAKR